MPELVGAGKKHVLPADDVTEKRYTWNPRFKQKPNQAGGKQESTWAHWGLTPPPHTSVLEETSGPPLT